jgi:hypothetical protein
MSNIPAILTRLCDQSASGHERARAYLTLSCELGLESPA